MVYWESDEKKYGKKAWKKSWKKHRKWTFFKNCWLFYHVQNSTITTARGTSIWRLSICKIPLVMPSRFKTPTTENTEHRRAFCSFLEFFKSGEREVGKIGGSETENLARGSMETTKMDGNFRTFKILETHRFLGVFRRQKIVLLSGLADSTPCISNSKIDNTFFIQHLFKLYQSYHIKKSLLCSILCQYIKFRCCENRLKKVKNSNKNNLKLGKLNSLKF